MIIFTEILIFFKKSVQSEMKHCLLIFNLILFSIICSQCNPPSKKMTACQDELCWENLIDSHLIRYPELQIEDLYKLVYQATLGNGHAISDSLEVAEWLKKDLSDPEQNTTEPMIDTLGTCGRFARIHLNTYIRSGRSPEKIVRAFIKTGAQYPADSDAFFCALSVVREMSSNGKLPWKDSTVNNFLSEQAVKSYPAVHHTEKFNSKYHPHYRIISIKLIPELFNGSSGKISDQDYDSVVTSGDNSDGKTNNPANQDSDC